MPELGALLTSHGYRHVLDITHPRPGGKSKTLDHLYLHHNIPGGVDAASMRAKQSIRLWDRASAMRKFKGTGDTEETIYGVNCGGMPEAFVATAGNDSKLFPMRVSCSCDF